MKDLVRNPLGIVALFISLIYAFANLLLGTTVSSLTEQERYPLIIFIVLFPVIVLGVFYRLVSKHHGKLYAPGDYKDDQSFLRTLSAEERQEKLELELAEAVLPDARPTETLPAIVGPQPAPEVSDRLLMTKTTTQNLSRLYDEIRLTETAGLAYLERHFGPIEAKDVAIQDTGVNFDAVLKSSDKHIFAEVKILRTAVPSTSQLDRALYNAVVADKFFAGKFKLVLLVVYRFDREELPRIESVWRRRVERCPADVELKFVHASEIAA